MCLVAFAWRCDPQRPLLLLANRDEFFERPSTPLQPWHEQPQLLAGRDLRAGGTWLGYHRAKQRLAVVTNVREGGASALTEPRSRGALIPEFLNAELSLEHYAQQLQQNAQHYEGFNVLLFDAEQAVCVSNRSDLQRIEPGVHGLSNAQLNTPWPKVEAVKAGLQAALDQGQTVEAMEEIMRDRSIYADQRLPSTGVPLAWERKLSAVCIDHDAQYGTRALTSVCLRADGSAQLREWSRQSLGDEWTLAELAVEAARHEATTEGWLPPKTR